jgi:hypothetical protein
LGGWLNEWFSLGIPASSTIKTGRHEKDESVVKRNKSIKLIICPIFAIILGPIFLLSMTLKLFSLV